MINFAFKSILMALILFLGANFAELPKSFAAVEFAENSGDMEACEQALSAVVRLESLFGKIAEVVDISHIATESNAFSDPRLKVVDVTKIAEGSKALLGFGLPNVYLVVPQENEAGERELYKVAAKSLKRGDTTYQKIKRGVQSGLMITFDDLTEEELTRLHESAQSYEGTRKWTCVNTNCRVLEDAGFTIGDDLPSRFYFPRALLQAIVTEGIQLNGRDVEFTLYRTAPQYLEDYNQSIARAVRSTLCRHTDRACNSAVQSDSKLKVYMAKIGRRLVAFLRPKAERADTTIIDGHIVQMQPEDGEPEVSFSVSEPSRLGYMMRLLWGPHAFHEIDISHIGDELRPLLDMGYLEAFPNGPRTLVDRLKQTFLFPKPVINAIRSHMAASYSTFENMGISNLFNMMRVHTAQEDNRYNFVMTRTKIIIVKVSMRASIPDWVLAKHVLASGYSDEVLMAGEMWKEADGTIVANNESGSYQPPGYRLELFGEIFSNLLPGYRIETQALE